MFRKIIYLSVSFLLLTGIMAAYPANVQRQPVLPVGIVADRVTYQGIGGVEITITPAIRCWDPRSGIKTKTDNLGKYFLPKQISGLYLVNVKKTGYSSINEARFFKSGKVSTFNFFLVAVKKGAIQEAGIVVPGKAGLLVLKPKAVEQSIDSVRPQAKVISSVPVEVSPKPAVVLAPVVAAESQPIDVSPATVAPDTAAVPSTTVVENPAPKIVVTKPIEPAPIVAAPIAAETTPAPKIVTTKFTPPAPIILPPNAVVVTPAPKIATYTFIPPKPIVFPPIASSGSLKVFSVSPQNNTTFTSGDSITCSVSATDDQSQTLSYRFSLDGAVISDWSSNPQYILSTNDSLAGSRKVMIEVKDSSNEVTLTSAIYVAKGFPRPQ